MNAAERAAFRAFVRANHPDRGGDPEAFVAGLARLRSGDPSGPPSRGTGGPDTSVRPGGSARAGTGRYDRPVVVTAHRLPARAAAAVARAWRRRRRTRVDRPAPATAAGLPRTIFARIPRTGRTR